MLCGLRAVRLRHCRALNLMHATKASTGLAMWTQRGRTSTVSVRAFNLAPCMQQKPLLIMRRDTQRKSLLIMLHPAQTLGNHALRHVDPQMSFLKPREIETLDLQMLDSFYLMVAHSDYRRTLR
jgi:hypothetical protein